jgi:hypothetical protein
MTSSNIKALFTLVWVGFIVILGVRDIDRVREHRHKMGETALLQAKALKYQERAKSMLTSAESAVAEARALIAANKERADLFERALSQIRFYGVITNMPLPFTGFIVTNSIKLTQDNANTNYVPNPNTNYVPDETIRKYIRSLKESQ